MIPSPDHIPSSSVNAMAPLSLRKSDAVYLLFFAVHIVVMLNVDLYPLYPAALRPGYMTTLREWYITTYNDRFFSSPPYVPIAMCLLSLIDPCLSFHVNFK